MTAPESPRPNVQGDAIGHGIAGSGNIIGKDVTVQGNIIQLHLTPEAVQYLRELQQVPTEVQADKAAGVEGSRVPKDIGLARGAIDQLLGVFQATARQGAQTDSVAAGDVQMSRVELLVKKAVLLRAEADQLYFDALQRNKGSLGAGPGSGRVDVDLASLLGGFDERAHASKLNQAYAALREANELDPANTEVLLHMAELLIELTPDDPSDEQQLLYRVQRLLREPRDETERFRLAQATFLLAASHEPPHADLLRDAREQFARLGRSIWVKQCDDLLASLSTSPGWHVSSGPQSGSPGWTEPGNAAWNATPGMQSGISGATAPQIFNPAGSWHVRVSDFVGSTIEMHLWPNGAFQMTQQAGFGVSIEASGQWVYVPQSQALHLQGMVGGFQPFMLGISIQAPQPGGFYGVGSDGFAYFLSKTGDL